MSIAAISFLARSNSFRAHSNLLRSSFISIPANLLLARSNSFRAFSNWRRKSFKYDYFHLAFGTVPIPFAPVQACAASGSRFLFFRLTVCGNRTHRVGNGRRRWFLRERVLPFKTKGL